MRQSYIYDYSGTCVGALRDKTHDSRARHQAEEEDETTHEHSPVRLDGRAGARASRAATMTAQSVVTRNDGYRGWRHERAVTMPTKRSGGRVGGGRQVAATADGCMRGQHT